MSRNMTKETYMQQVEAKDLIQAAGPSAQAMNSSQRWDDRDDRGVALNLGQPSRSSALLERFDCVKL